MSALPAGRRHIWVATAASVTVVLVAAVLARALTSRPLDAWSSQVLAFATWEGAYLALTWRALLASDAPALRLWAVEVTRQPRRRVRDLLFGRSVGFSLPLWTASYGFAAGLYVLPRAADLVPQHVGTVRVLAIAAVATAWLGLHLSYALHYAYEACRPGGGGLEFPGQQPDGPDFAYFSLGVGTTFGTTDVAVTGGRLRRVVLGHQLLAFVFNTAVLGLVVTQLFP